MASAALTTWLGRLLGPGRWVVPIVVAAITIVAGQFALEARVERNSESMNGRTAAQREVYDRFVGSFGSDETIVVAVRDDGMLDPAGIARLRRLAGRIAAIDGVARVRSLLDAVEIVAGPFGADAVPLVPGDGAADRRELEAALERNPDLTGALISPDRRTAGLLVEIEDRPADGRYRSGLVDALRALKAEEAEAGRELHVTGITVQKHDMTRFVARDQRVILPASVVVFAVLLALITRRRSGVVLPFAVAAIALVWTIGLLTALGDDLNVITSLLPPVIMALSIATSIHLYQEWIATSRHETDARRLAYVVVERLGLPCFLTALTTALGLASLTVSDIPAVQQFGAFAALGVVVSFGLNITLLPLAFSLLRPDKRRRRGPSRLTPLLDGAVAVTIRHPAAVVAGTVVLTALAVVGATRVENNTDLVSFLRPDTELVLDTTWVDRELVGTNALEYVIERADGAPLTDPGDLRSVDALARRVAGLPAVTTVVGIAPIVARVHQAEAGLDEPTLPEDPDDLLYVFDVLAASGRDELRGLMTPDLTRTRLAVRLHALGSAAGQRLIEEIDRLAGETLAPGLTAAATGSFHGMVLDSNRLVRSQVASFALALLTILLTMALFFRSLPLLFAALIPNLVPIVWCGGLMGWLGIDLSTATTMIASVVIGIAVDDTIHYLAGFRREHRGDVALAVRVTTHRTGRVLVIVSVVLALGFWVGALGSFRPTVWFSLLTGGTILAALVCDLVVLPACLMLARPRPRTIVS